MVKIPASLAMLRILEQWGVKKIYGYPAGSVNSLMNALDHEQKRLRFIQVRHEQVGALAAAAHAKLTGQLGVAFGSAGPGAVNMLDGLYDAKEDHVPVLAIVGQANSYNLNYNYFQAIPETPIFQDVAVYDRTIMNPESLPHVVDRAIRLSYDRKGVSVVVIPNNWGFIKIPSVGSSGNQTHFVKRSVKSLIPPSLIHRFLVMVKNAKRPIFHVGSGIGHNGHRLFKLSRRLQVPIVIDGPAKRLLAEHVADLGTSNHDVSKSADEIFALTDLVIDIGNDYSNSPAHYYDYHPKVIQITSNSESLGQYSQVDLTIHASPKVFLTKILSVSRSMTHKFFRAAVMDNHNWQRYLLNMTLSHREPIIPAAVYHQINRIANQDAIFSVDIGDNLVNSFRFLRLTAKNKLIYSVHFATMGCSLPGAIAAQLDYPHRQVFSIAGDGAFSMVMQDLITMRKYHLPIINVVTSNGTTNYIREKQTSLAMKNFGNRLSGQNFAMIARGMGVRAVNVRHFNDLSKAFDRAKRVTALGVPFLINVVISDQQGLPVEDLRLDRIYLKEGVQIGRHVDWDLRKFFNRYGGQKLKSLPEFLS